MKTTTQKDAYLLPVSRKFYARLKERITSVFASLGQPCSPLTLDKMMSAIRLYMKGSRGLVRSSMPDETCYVIFLTLRAEIDTAITRSTRAREAAARRRVLRQSTIAPTAPAQPSDTIIEPAEDHYSIETSESPKHHTPSDASKTSVAPASSATVHKFRYGIKAVPARRHTIDNNKHFRR